MPDVGLSFSPTQAPNQYGQGQGGRSGPSNPVMDAIKILSFRVPQILGPGSPVAPGLLAGQGGATPGLGGNDAALIQQWLQRFFGQGLNQGNQVAPPDTPAPQGSGFGGFDSGPTPAPQAPQAPSEPGRVAIQFPARPVDRNPAEDVSPVTNGPQAPTWGDIGGAQRSFGPAAPIPRGGGFGGFLMPDIPQF